MPRKKKVDARMNEAEELELMCQGTGWAIARRMFMEKLAELGDIMSFNEEVDGNKLAIELAAKQLAINSMIAWLKSIDTQISNQRAYREAMSAAYNPVSHIQIEEE